jgi:hypothetical protein
MLESIQKFNNREPHELREKISEHLLRISHISRFPFLIMIAANFSIFNTPKTP